MTEYASDSLPTRKILVTSALPYANGSIHLGHMLEHIQTDIWVRFQKMRGHDCHYVCADDAHGTPIMLSAQKSGVSPQALIDQVHKEHTADFRGFLVHHDNYYTTHSPENKAFAEKIYNRLKKAGYITSKVIKQAYDAEKGMFLPDRFVKGECPNCHSPDQYGDNCDQCGATYDPTELINPYSVLSGSTPIEKDSEQFFFDLPQFESFLSEWLSEEHVQPEIANKIREWFTDGLHPWDISRNAPYWGFEIPGQKDKYFYVWMDAPIGYMASFKNYCEQKQLNFSDYWSADSEAELHHFIGKDIARFHTLFWPAMLKGANYRTPTAVYCHGFLTVNGEKMSKSRGTFIQAATYLEHLKPEYLRYYFASRLSNKIEDMDMNIEEFRQKVNADLIGKVVNIASRSAGFIRKHFNNRLSSELDNPILFGESMSVAADVADYYENRQYSSAMRDIMQFADEVNQYIDAEKPWVMIKDDMQRDKVHAVCTTAINLFKQLMLMLTPVLPNVAQDSQAFLQMESWDWSDLSELLLDKEIANFQPLLQRIEEEQMTAMMDATKALAEKEAASAAPAGSPSGIDTSADSVDNGDMQTEADVFAELDNLLDASLDESDTPPASASAVEREVPPTPTPAPEQKPEPLKRVIPEKKSSDDELPMPQDVAAILAQASESTKQGIVAGKKIPSAAEIELAESNSKERLLVLKKSEQLAAEKNKAAAKATSTLESADNAYITIDDFAKIDLRVGVVIDAKSVEEADKLLHLTVDIGESEPRSIFAGIKKHVAVNDILGMNVVVVSNLKPRKMRFGMSEGMVLCASGGDDIFIINPADGSLPGMPIK